MTARVSELTIDAIETPTARLKLAQRVKPYWYKVSRGVSIGYRAGPGSWVVRGADGKGGNWVRKLGQADDTDKANGDGVLTYAQALDKARLLGRGGDATDPNAGRRPVTVEEAIADYRSDLLARRQSIENASQASCHLTPALLSKPVTLLNARELKAWRDGLLAKGHNRASINRRGKAIKAALNLAVRLDPRITNAAAWTNGLAFLTEDSRQEIEDCDILEDEQRGAIVRQAYAINDDLGIYIELHDATGMRTSQIRMIPVRSLQGGAKPMLLVPSALKGKNRGGAQRKMIPIPISTDLAARLKRYAAGRKPNDLLLHKPDGAPWGDTDLTRKGRNGAISRRIIAAAGLDADVITLYAFRHTKIVRALKSAKLHEQAIAATFDTSLPMIKKTYGKWIVHKVQDELRDALVDDVEIGGNVVRLRG